MDVYDLPKKEGRTVKEERALTPPSANETAAASKAKVQAEIDALKKMADTSTTYTPSYTPTPSDAEMQASRDRKLSSFEHMQEESLRPSSPPSEGPGLNMVSIILTVVIAAVTLMVGLVVAGNVMSNLPQTPESSQMATTVAQVASNTGTAFNFLALGLFVIAAVFIISIVAGVMGRSD